VTRSPANAAAQLIGQVLDGKYRLEAIIGRGGMGAVFRGLQLRMDRRIAVKVIHPELAADPAVARRFAREAKGTFKVESDHAIKVIDFAASAEPMPGLLYMVMELLDGRTVAKELDVDGPLAPRRALHVARQVALALAASHRIGIVHRDIKPDNIMLIRQGDDPDFAKVLDFGLAKLIEDAPGDAALSAVALTKHGMVFGTPDYMSPEQATGKTLDARSDVYALGATLFEMLTARPPFVGANAMAVLVQHVKAPPPRLADLAPSLAPHVELERLIQRCLAKAPRARPPTALDFVELLDRVATTLPPAEVRPSLAANATMQLPARPASGTHSLWLARLSEQGEADPEAPPPLITQGGGWGVAPAPPDPTGATGLADGLEPETGASRPVQIRRWPVVAALLAAVGGIAVVVAIKARGATASRSDSRTASLADALATVVERVDAAPAPVPTPDAASGSAAPPPDAGVDAAPRGKPDPDVGRDRRREIAQHLAAAEAGHTTHNRLKQMTEADEVLHLDARNSRANFLFGDALVQAGDLANGCSYLKRARGAAARTRFTEAGCK